MEVRVPDLAHYRTQHGMHRGMHCGIHSAVHFAGNLPCELDMVHHLAVAQLERLLHLQHLLRARLLALQVLLVPLLRAEHQHPDGRGGGGEPGAQLGRRGTGGGAEGGGAPRPHCSSWVWAAGEGAGCSGGRHRVRRWTARNCSSDGVLDPRACPPLGGPTATGPTACLAAATATVLSVLHVCWGGHANRSCSSWSLALCAPPSAVTKPPADVPASAWART
eukprot:scaffold65444_cov59-Phaeocystis_antarctica.AAC.4